MSSAREALHEPGLLYHFHVAGAPHVPAGAISEVREKRPRAGLALWPVGEDLELAALEPRGEIHRERLTPAATRDSLTQHESVADVEKEWKADQHAQRGGENAQHEPSAVFRDER